jgi:ATP-binding cassette, subfamily F, member 3
MAPKLKAGTNPTTKIPSITAISQQSRFHTETLDTAVAEIDLKGVTISVGQRELIIDSRLKLKEGVHYALVGRSFIFNDQIHNYSIEI